MAKFDKYSITSGLLISTVWCMILMEKLKGTENSIWIEILGLVLVTLYGYALGSYDLVNKESFLIHHGMITFAAWVWYCFYPEDLNHFIAAWIVAVLGNSGMFLVFKLFPFKRKF